MEPVSVGRGEKTGVKRNAERGSTTLPPFKLLNIIDQRSVVPLRKLAEQEEEKTEIQRPQARVLVPWHGLVVDRRGGLEGAAICGALFWFPQHCILMGSSPDRIDFVIDSFRGSKGRKQARTYLMYVCTVRVSQGE